MPKVVPIKRRPGRPTTTQGFPQMVIRLPPDIYEKINADAAHHYISRNATVIRCLRIYYDKLKKD